MVACWSFSQRRWFVHCFILIYFNYEKNWFNFDCVIRANFVRLKLEPIRTVWCCWRLHEFDTMNFTFAFTFIKDEKCVSIYYWIKLHETFMFFFSLSFLFIFVCHRALPLLLTFLDECAVHLLHAKMCVGARAQANRKKFSSKAIQSECHPYQQHIFFSFFFSACSFLFAEILPHISIRTLSEVFFFKMEFLLRYAVLGKFA